MSQCRTATRGTIMLSQVKNLRSQYHLNVYLIRIVELFVNSRCIVDKIIQYCKNFAH